MLLFLKLVDETQILRPPEPTRPHSYIKLLNPSELIYFALFNMRHPVEFDLRHLKLVERRFLYLRVMVMSSIT